MGENFYRIHIESREFSGLIGSKGPTLKKSHVGLGGHGGLGGHVGLGGHGDDFDRMFEEFNSDFFKTSIGSKNFENFDQNLTGKKDPFWDSGFDKDFPKFGTHKIERTVETFHSTGFHSIPFNHSPQNPKQNSQNSGGAIGGKSGASFGKDGATGGYSGATGGKSGTSGGKSGAGGFGVHSGSLGGGGGSNIRLEHMLGGLIRKDFGDAVGKLVHRYAKIDSATGRILGAIAGNTIYGFGGKHNVLGNLGKVVLDSMMSGKWKRKVKSFVPVEPTKTVSKAEPTNPLKDSGPGSGPGPGPGRTGAPGPSAPAIANKGQDFNSIRSDCLAKKILFEDPTFPAADSSLFYSQPPPCEVQWKRPGEIIKDPLFFEEGHCRFDVIQGELGDCWLLAAVACLTLRDELFFRVVPPDQSFTENYAGIFHFQFWQYGQWVDVVIDDRLPTFNGKLLYLHSEQNNEFWSALVEKAYAKLNGSYEALTGGSTSEALEDFTGGITELINLTENPPKNLVQMMFKAFQFGSLLGCSIQGDGSIEGKLSNGLVVGHAYSITGTQMIDGKNGKTPLLRIRNPWGDASEWNGPWSDNSVEWTQISDAQKKQMGLIFDHDGEFWMSFDDFVKNFETLEICNLGPEVMDEIEDMTGKRPEVKGEWQATTIEGAWIRGKSAGGCRNFIETFATNPQYAIDLIDSDQNDADNLGTCIVRVLQKNRRQLRSKGEDLLPIGFSIYQAEKNKKLDRSFFESNQAVGRSPVFVNLREVCGRYRFPAGNYVVVPSTFDPNIEAEFMMRIFCESRSDVKFLG